MKTLLEYIEEYKAFDKKINDLKNDLERLPKDMSPALIETVNDEIRKLEKAKKTFGEQNLYTKDYIENERLWSK